MAVLPFIFPEWAKNYRNELSGIKTATNSAQFLKTTARVNWLKAFNKANREHLVYVGAGRHKFLRDNPGMKKKCLYAGHNLLMMKTYVSEYDISPPKERAELDAAGQTMDFKNIAATDVEQTDAADYCASLGAGHRLPKYAELVVVSLLFEERNENGKIGKALKPNLNLRLLEGVSLWTADPKPSDSWFSWLDSDSDDFRVFTPGQDAEIYKDDGYDSADLGFLCVREVK